jgi:hypothetical protein
VLRQRRPQAEISNNGFSEPEYLESFVTQPVDPREAIERSARLRARAAESPLVEAVGVVGPIGAGAGKSGRETLWTLRFKFDAWRLAEGPLQQGKLMISRKVSDEEYRALQASIEPYSLLRVQARIAIDEEKHESIGFLEQILGVAIGDAELERISQQLQKPVIYTDQIFGELTLDRRFDLYSGDATWRGKSVKLFVKTNGAGPGDAAAVAHELWKQQDHWDFRVRECASQRLTELKNDSWLDEDDQPMSEAEFREKMVLREISVSQQGAFEFWFDDGDMFWGHAIHVGGTLQDGPRNADIAG